MIYSIYTFSKSFLMRRQITNTGKIPHKDYFARSVLRTSSFRSASWKNENILILGDVDPLFELAKDLSSCGASVSFKSLRSLKDLYSLPIEQYSMVIMTSGSRKQQFDVVDVGGILRRADTDLVLVWASKQFKLSTVSNATTNAFCDIQLALPASSSHLESFLSSPST